MYCVPSQLYNADELNDVTNGLKDGNVSNATSRAKNACNPVILPIGHPDDK